MSTAALLIVAIGLLAVSFAGIGARVVRQHKADLARQQYQERIASLTSLVEDLTEITGGDSESSEPDAFGPVRRRPTLGANYAWRPLPPLPEYIRRGEYPATMPSPVRGSQFVVGDEEPKRRFHAASAVATLADIAGIIGTALAIYLAIKYGG